MARGARRLRRRMACRITSGGKVFSGVILDLSATGVFVQTSAKPRPGEGFALEISVPGQRAPLRLEAQVARVQVVPPSLLNVAHGGIGLRITNAPEGYFAFLAAVLPGDGAEAQPTTAPTSSAREAPGAVALASRAFRVRVTQTGGARSRTLRVRAPSAEAAAARALEETGEGWKVLECIDDEAAPAG